MAPQNRVKKCCQSMPRCERCPLRLAPAAQAHEQRNGLATLVEEVFRGSPRALPDSVTDVLTSLALARRSRSSPRAQ